MSLSTISQTQTIVSSSNLANIDRRERALQPRNFFFLIPTITGIAMGILLFPNFGLGLAAGAVGLVVSIIAMGILKKLKIIKLSDEKNSEYHKDIRKSLLAVVLFGPIAEEGIFRGFMQPLLTRGIQILVPAATAVLFGTGLSIATAVSIAATAVIFGAAHYFNPHKDSHVQAVSCTISGVVMGILAAQFGIGAAIAAHVANNSIIGLFAAFSSSRENDNARPQKKFDFSDLPA
jgi:membrane protease YdiL (CAAX protease family)